MLSLHRLPPLLLPDPPRPVRPVSAALLVLLSLLDVGFIVYAYHSTVTRGASVQLVFGFEYAILLTAVGYVLVKYVLHTVDLQREAPWENKAVHLLHTELLIGETPAGDGWGRPTGGGGGQIQRRSTEGPACVVVGGKF